MAEENEKILIQVTDPWGSGAFPLDWNKLPDSVLSELKPENTITALSYSESETGNFKTVVYFRIVKKFRKGIKEFDNGDVIFGI